MDALQQAARLGAALPVPQLHLLLEPGEYVGISRAPLQQAACVGAALSVPQHVYVASVEHPTN